MTEIVYLDSYVLNPGDLSWESLTSLGACTIHDRTNPADIVERAKDAVAILTNKCVIDQAVMEALPKLRYIGVTATGYNIIDVKAAAARNIVVTNAPNYGPDAVAQAVFALLLDLTNHVGHYNRQVQAGHWHASPDFCYWDRPLISLAGLTMGIVGFGNIARAVAKIAHAFGMNILVHTRTPPSEFAEFPVTFCGLDDLFSRSDVVSLHCPLTPETREFVNAARLDTMKPSAFLINTARGPLIDEKALADALNRGRIAGAGVDVLSVEPPRDANPLLTAKNCTITPHIAWASVASRRKLLDISVNNLRAFLEGRPVNVVTA